MSSLHFEKWQGLGNDFILVEAAALGDQDPATLARRLCDRRLGIGGDGLLLIEAGSDSSSMVVYNADGSRPEMCGNGLRCVAGYLASRGRAHQLAIATDAGARPVTIERLSEQRYLVAVEMGVATLHEPLPVVHGSQRLVFARVGMGNPHAITFEPLSAEARDALGPQIEAAVAGGTNVEFGEISDQGIRLAVWERGVGYTQACGTGACATVVAAIQAGLWPGERVCRVTLPGGDLEIRVDPSLTVRMTGPAVRVFSGEI